MDVELQEESELDLGLLPMEDKGFQFDLESQGVTERRWVVLLRCDDIELTQELLAAEDVSNSFDAEFEAT